MMHLQSTHYKAVFTLISSDFYNLYQIGRVRQKYYKNIAIKAQIYCYYCNNAKQLLCVF